MWNIRSDFVKDYVTVKWFRPFRARKFQSSGERDLRVLLDPSRIPEKWEEKTSDRNRISHSTQPLVNILRRPWDAKLQLGVFSAWEERVSVWSTQLGKFRIVVLLLDPMPAISHTIANVEVERYPQGLPQVQSRHRERIQRSSEELEDRDPENGRSRIKISIPGVSWFAQLFLRVFKFDTLGRMSDEAIPSAASHESGSHRSAQRSVREDAQLANTYREYCMFIACSVRGPYSDTMISDKKQRFARGLQSYSTTNMLKQLLQPYDVLVPDRSTPLEGLIQFIVHDTFKILQLIDLALTRMNLQMLDDMRVQEHIDDWRRELHRLDTELRTMESSIPEFADSVLETQRCDSYTTAAKGSRAIHELLGRFKKQVTQVQRQTESTHRSLMAALSLIENKRGISEAESVTKLTELAFFFIPLTFAATLFSMQVKELDGSTSVGLFLAVASAITICSYGLRLVIRSSRFLDLCRRWAKVIRDEQEIRPSSPIATSAVLIWVWQRLHTHVWPVYMMIALAALLAALWTRPLREGMKIGITMALAMICLAFTFILFSTRLWISEDWVRRHRRRLGR
ncbi:MAG: hypothetical protein LQ349_007597 [Xanthoria aureola]|nr:MAG: hypothetical protein LQ349_007597 [Xanthoria aureola]